MKTDLTDAPVPEKTKQKQNQVIVDLCISDERDLYNRYTFLSGAANNANLKINDNVIDFIQSEIKNISFKNSVVVAVKLSDEISCELGFIEKIIKENAAGKMKNLQKELIRTIAVSLALAVVGMGFIGLLQILHFSETRYALHELIIVMSWVFMWTAIDGMFFKRPKLMREKVILMKILNSEVTAEQ